MTETIEQLADTISGLVSGQDRHIDKSTWADGPWMTEPDYAFWNMTYQGKTMKCFALRHDVTGHWCGYAGVTEGDPLYGVGYPYIEDEVYCHGGLTFAGVIDVTETNVWWIGFDCCHAGDVSPGLDAVLSGSGHQPIHVQGHKDVYRTFAYVQLQALAVAMQLIDLDFKGEKSGRAATSGVDDDGGEERVWYSRSM